MAPQKYPGIPNPSDDPKQHTQVLRVLKEGLEIGQRLRGDPLDSFVRLRELVDLGIVRDVGGDPSPPSGGTVALTGGDVLEVLRKNSATDGDYSWVLDPPQGPTFTYSGGVLDRIDYASDGSYKLFTYTGGALSRVDHHILGRIVRKDFVYSSGVLTSITRTVI